MAEFFTVADVPGTGGGDKTYMEQAEGYSISNGVGDPDGILT